MPVLQRAYPMYLECIFTSHLASDLSSMGSPILSLFPEAAFATVISIREWQATSTKVSNQTNVDFHGCGLGWIHVAIYKCPSFAEGQRSCIRLEFRTHRIAHLGSGRIRIRIPHVVDSWTDVEANKPRRTSQWWQRRTTSIVRFTLLAQSPPCHTSNVRPYNHTSPSPATSTLIHIASCSGCAVPIDERHSAYLFAPNPLRTYVARFQDEFGCRSVATTNAKHPPPEDAVD